ncbi:MAG: LysM peptidoglycan-binding domain-containing protein, partial [Chloroflexota bacterium]
VSPSPSAAPAGPAGSASTAGAATQTLAPPPATQAPPSSPAPVGHVTYSVALGDTLAELARRYNTPVAAIMARNGLSNADYIRPGQALVIPAGAGANGGPMAAAGTPAATTARHTVQRGDTLWSLARRYGTHPREILARNGAAIANPDQLTPGTVLVIPLGAAPLRTHAVRRGESLASIAQRYGVETQELIRANGLANPNRIVVGQVLVIP